MTARYILLNRAAGPDLEPGAAEFLALDSDGETVRRFSAPPETGRRYARRYGLEAIAPARLLYLWRQAAGEARP